MLQRLFKLCTYTLSFAAGALLTAHPASAAVQALTVPWVAAQPVIPHDAISGAANPGNWRAATTVKGTCTGGCTQYMWDFGDGSPATAWTGVSDPYNLGVQHTYSGSTGQTFTAVLTVKDGSGNTATANYYVAIRDNTQQTQINMAIDQGLWYLHTTMSRGQWPATAPYNAPPYNSQAYGNWTGGSAGSGYTANQAANMNAFEVNGHLAAGPATDPYSETVARATAWVLSKLAWGTLPTGLTNPTGTLVFNSTPDDGGTPGYVGLNTGDGANGDEDYQMGAVMDAIVASGTKTAVAANGPVGVVGRRYIDIVTQMVNRYSYCQNPTSNGGGWYYSCRQTANDNSICQWASIGMIAAEDWGVTLPTAMMKWNQTWLVNSQNTSNGVFGYTSTSPLWGPYATTPAGMVQMAMNGIGRGSTAAGATGLSTTGGPYWDLTEAFMRNNFANSPAGGYGSSIRAYYYGMFSFVKSMLLHNTDGHPGSSPITMLRNSPTDAGIDWYGDPSVGVAVTLLGTQSTDGHWSGHNASGAQYSFETAWCIIMLNKTLFSAGAPVAVAKASPNPALISDTIAFDGTQSYQQDPTKQIVQWDWVFNVNDPNSAVASGPIVSTTYPNAQFGGSVTAKLTVTDNVGTKNSTTVTVTFKNPPIPPTANAGGPYTFCMNITPFFLDGSGSKLSDAGLHDASCPTCPGETITAYDWDLSGANTFTGAHGVQPDVTTFYVNKGAGTYLAQLKVTDNTASAFPSVGTNLSSVASTSVTVKANCQCLTDLSVHVNGSNQPQLTWSADGSPQFNVYRSLVSGGPYAKVAVVNGAAPGYVDTSAAPGNTYYYIVRSATLAGNETCQSAQVSITVNKLPTTTVLASSLNPSIYGQSVTLTATVAPSAATGTVTFSDAGNMLQTVPVNNGVATMTTSTFTAGAHNLTASYSGDGTYNPSIGNLTQQVNKAQATLTWATPAPITYGTALDGTQLNATASVPGAMAYAPAAGVILPVGNQTLNVTFTPTDTANYATATASVTLTVLPRAASVTPNAAAKTYGGADPALTGTLTGFLPSDNVTATYSRTAGEAVGTYTISATLAPAGVLANYTLTNNTATFTINKANASVTPNAASKTYGTADPALTGTLAGFLPSDNVTAVYSRTPGENAGTYTISAALAPAGVLANYTIANNTAAFTINRAPLLVTSDPKTRFYASPNPPLTGSIAGLIAGDAITATFTTTATPASAPGTYPITPVLSDPGNRLPNYNVTNNIGLLTVAPAPVVVVSPNPLAFGSQNLLSSTTLNVNVQKIGTAPLSLPSVTIGGANAGDYTVVNNCGASVAAGSTCTLAVTFVPHALGASSGVLTLTDDNGGYVGSTQTVALTGSGVLSYGLFATSKGCGSIQFTGQTFTDSFDSAAGPYASSKANTGGDVAANGNAFLSGQAVINGKLYAANTTNGACTNGNTGVTTSGQSKVTEGVFVVPAVNFTTPGPFTAGANDVHANKSTSLTPGSYRDIQVSGNGTVLTLAPGTYNINSIHLAGNVSVVVSPAGPVTINVVGAGVDVPVDLSGGSIAGANNIPANLVIEYGGTNLISVTSGSASYGIVYAPNAPVQLAGKGGQWYGSVVVNSLKDSGQSAIHYDRALGR